MHIGKRISQERLRRRLSQEALAEALGVSVKSISRWEKGQALPQAHYRLKLSTFFDLAPELFFEEEEDGQNGSLQAQHEAIWYVPYPRNQHFTGRDELFDRLQQHLSLDQSGDSTTAQRVALTQPQALKGLGGIGKTQIAVEYAYRSREQGRYDHIFWINAAGEETIISSFVALAEVLPAFPAKDETDQHKLIAAIKLWIEQCQRPWLLIFDNADDISVVQGYLPQQGNGSILLTTRANAVGSVAASVEVEMMSFMEGIQLLLRRAQRWTNASEDEVNEAGNIVIALDHFPLALDQAGAYIEETGCNFSTYLQLYQDHRKALLSRRGTQSTLYPNSVATTWSLSFQRIDQTNPAAAELLRLCAFLAPDHIPEELLKDGADYWPSTLQQATRDLFVFNQMVETLLTFSLVKRLSDDQALSIHRLVQAVLKDDMKVEEQRRWAERAVQATYTVFPQSIEQATWASCRRYLSQAQICSEWIEDFALDSVEAASLLMQTALYLQDTGLYKQAEPLLQRALQIKERTLGTEHAEVAAAYHALGKLAQYQGHYAEGQHWYQQALHIQEQALGTEHPDIAETLNWWASLCDLQGKFAEAESLYQRALCIREQLGAEHPSVARTLNNFGIFYRRQGKYAEAEPLHQRALQILERQVEPKHLWIAIALGNLGVLYKCQGRYTDAEPLYQRALQIYEQQLGSEHPKIATLLNNLGNVYKHQEKYIDAEATYKRALRINEQYLGPEHCETALTLNNLAELYLKQGKYMEAEPLCERALRINEQQLGLEHREVALNLSNLGSLYRNQGKDIKAELLLQRALRIREQQLGSEHPDLAHTLQELADVYRAQSKYTDAKPLYQRAISVHEKAVGSHHPFVADTLYGFAMLQEAQGNFQEAIDLYHRTFTIREKTFGSEHEQTMEAYTKYIKLTQSLNHEEDSKLSIPEGERRQKFAVKEDI